MCSKIELDFLGTTDVLKFLEDNIIVFISRSQMLYDTNPMHENCDIKDENPKYLAGDFSKEEHSKNDDELKLKLKKKNQN